jgi:membrane-associated PAP2 superfamily phosphatase
MTRLGTTTFCLCFFTLLALIGVTLWLFEATDWDVQVQKAAFDFAQEQWFVSRNAQPWALLLYTLPKVIVGILAVLMLAALLGPVRLRARIGASRRGALFVLTCFVVSAASVGVLKDLSGVYCPSQLEIFGGTKPYLRLFEQVPPELGPLTPGRCFPAAHPSTPFACVSLVALWPRRVSRLLAFSLGLGWATGIYQMLRGAHFLSHVLVTCFWVFLCVLLLAQVFGVLHIQKHDSQWESAPRNGVLP